MSICICSLDSFNVNCQGRWNCYSTAIMVSKWSYLQNTIAGKSWGRAHYIQYYICICYTDILWYKKKKGRKTPMKHCKLPSGMRLCKPLFTALHQTSTVMYLCIYIKIVSFWSSGLHLGPNAIIYLVYG